MIPTKIEELIAQGQLIESMALVEEMSSLPPISYGRDYAQFIFNILEKKPSISDAELEHVMSFVAMLERHCQQKGGVLCSFNSDFNYLL